MMFSKKSLATGFKAIKKNDPFYCGSFYDLTGQKYLIMGKRFDWLYITDQDRIFTKDQIEKLIKYIPENKQYISHTVLKREEDSKNRQERLNHTRNDVSLLFVKTIW